jgi:hypothetical protein
MIPMVTDAGTPNQISWLQGADEIRKIPNLSGPAGIPLQGDPGMTVTGMPQQPPVAGVPGDLPGEWQGDWFMLPGDGGLGVANIRYVQTGPGSPQVHRVAESLQWRNHRLTVDPGRSLAVPVDATTCQEGFLITKPGQRIDGKVFSWAAGARFRAVVPDPITGVVFTVTLAQTYLFSAPAADQEPSESAVVVKVYPLLTVSMSSSLPSKPLPAFAADLRMEFAPRLTREDQHRPAAFYPGGITAPPNQRVVANVFCDTNTNDSGRPIPGTGTPPAVPIWPTVFDYGEPDLSNELAFDAVVFPDTLANTSAFQCVETQIALAPGNPNTTIPITTTLNVQRAPRQGQFDNVHIHPFVGADPPGRNLVEAPLAADEVIHMHWRWGAGVPSAALQGNRELATQFMGYSSTGPNEIAGAPLIPFGQSLRIKIGRAHAPAADDNSGASSAPLTTDAVVVWYSPTMNHMVPRKLTQFMGHGFGLAYRLRDLVPIVFGTPLPFAAVSNSDLLGDTAATGMTYHDFRWSLLVPGFPQQRVFTASAQPGLSLNRTGLPGDPNQQTFS